MIISGITISTPKFINGSLEKTAKNITIKKDVPMMYASIIFFAVSYSESSIFSEKINSNTQKPIENQFPFFQFLKDQEALFYLMRKIYGILNGTTNYILTEMLLSGKNFNDVLDEAKELGYAESDPTFDIGGIDAAHKLTILASICFGIPLNYDSVYVEGIEDIDLQDLNNAMELGYTIKHLAIARKSKYGIELRVHPCLVPNSRLLANVNGVKNAVVVNSDAAGPTLYYGAGAGSSATASSVVSDIICLLYTSPSPRDRTRSRMPSSA